MLFRSAHLGFPIVGDDKYGDFDLNKALKKQLLARMFLHAFRLRIAHPDSGESMQFEAPVAKVLAAALQNLEATRAAAV